MNMNTNQYPTIRSRLAIVLFVLAASFGAILSFILYINYSNELRDNLRHRLENITTLAGLQQNGDELENVHAQGDEYYNIILDRYLCDFANGVVRIWINHRKLSCQTHYWLA